MAPSTSVSSASRLHPTVAATAADARAARAMVATLQSEAQAQLALNELFPHLRVASDAALRDIFVSLRVPARAMADA